MMMKMAATTMRMPPVTPKPIASFVPLCDECGVSDRDDAAAAEVVAAEESVADLEDVRLVADAAWCEVECVSLADDVDETRSALVGTDSVTTGELDGV